MLKNDFNSLDIEKNEPITNDDVHRHGLLGLGVPVEYMELLKLSDGLIINDNLVLYSSDSIAERNLTYEIEKYFSGWILIGDDSGGNLILMEKNTDISPVYCIDAGCSSKKDAILVGLSLSNWFELGCKCSNDAENADFFDVDVWLINAPLNGLRGTLKIKEALGMSTSTPEVLKLFKNINVLIATIPYWRYKKLALVVNRDEQCMEFRKAGTGNVVNDN